MSINNKWKGKIFTLGVRTKYPWEKWLKEGATHNLVRGKHYGSSTHQFVSYLYQKATYYGAKIRVIETDKGVRLTALEGMKESA